MTDQIVPQRDYYVYALFREDGVTPFYIGKGKGYRIRMHDYYAERKHSHKNHIIMQMRSNNVPLKAMKLLDNLSDNEAKQIEIDLIRLIGRQPVGPLVNQTSGGEGTSDLSPDAAHRRASGVRGRNPSVETRQRISEASKNLWSESREKILNGMKKRPLPSVETRAKMSAFQKSRPRGPRSKETKQKLREARARQAPLSDEARAKVSAALRARPPISEETRAKRRASILRYLEEQKRNL